MSPKYKLTYFPVQALGESIRYLLAYGELEFEDYRINRNDWIPKLKPQMPFGKMPILEFEGRTLHQHVAICRYLARQVNLMGKDDLENADIDIFVDTLADARAPLMSYYYDPNPATKAPKLDPIQKDTIPFYFSKFEGQAKNNGGYMVGGHLTWADLYLASNWDYLKDMSEVDLDRNYPNMAAVVRKVQSLPQIKAWIARRPPNVLS